MKTKIKNYLDGDITIGKLILLLIVFAIAFAVAFKILTLLCPIEILFNPATRLKYFM